ncbi:hypothetical protein Tco_1512259, partial [Tanacetum coccineum]
FIACYYPMCIQLTLCVVFCLECTENNSLDRSSATRIDNPSAQSEHHGLPARYMYLGTSNQAYQHCGARFRCEERIKNAPKNT